MEVLQWVRVGHQGRGPHRLACAARDRALEDDLPLVTTDFVADETLTLLRLRLGVSPAEMWRQQTEGASAISNCT